MTNSLVRRPEFDQLIGSLYYQLKVFIEITTVLAFKYK